MFRAKLMCRIDPQIHFEVKIRFGGDFFFFCRKVFKYFVEMEPNIK